MVKFADKLIANRVVEWQDSYVDYDGLKKLLKKIGRTRASASSDIAPSRRGSGDLGVFRSASPIMGSLTAAAAFLPAYGATSADPGAAATDPDEEFFAAIEREANKAEAFYAKKCAELQARFENIGDSIKKLRLTVRRHSSREGLGGGSESDEEDVSTGMHHMQATESIKRSAMDLYRQLNYLMSFTILNYTAFVKICKKHDKMIKVRASKRAMQVVEARDFSKASSLKRMVSELERLYADEFCSRNITVARSDLLVKHRNTDGDFELIHVGFRLGVVAVLVCWVLWVLAIDSIIKPTALQLPGTVFVVYRGISTFVLGQWLWVLCLYAWESARVNYIYLFEFDPRHHMSPLKVARRASTVTILFLVNLLVYLKVARGEMVGLTPEAAVWFPISMFCFCLLFAFVARLGGVGGSVLNSVLMAPFVQVTFFQSFVADVMTSLVRPLVDTTFSVCFFLSGDWRTPTKESMCMQAWAYHHVVVPLVVTLPLWFRFAQCLRRYYDTGHRVPNLLNATKYVIAYSVVMFGTFGQDDASFHHLWLVAAVISTTITYCWDVWMDWGLGRPQHALLRDRLMFSGKAPYYLAITLDLGLRFLWTVTLLPSIAVFLAGGSAPGVATNEQSPMSMYVTALISWAEISRRSMWACLRVEHEHLVNTQGYRRVDIVPLHFDTPLENQEGEHKRAHRRPFGLLFEVIIFVSVLFLVAFTSFRMQWSAPDVAV